MRFEYYPYYYWETLLLLILHYLGSQVVVAIFGDVVSFLLNLCCRWVGVEAF